MRHVIATDFDGTLTTRDTLLEFIRYAVGTPCFVWGFILNSPYILLMLLKLYPNWKAKERVFTHFFRGMPEEQFITLGVRFATDNRHLLRPGAVKMMREAKEKGVKIYIVTASIVQWVQPFFPDTTVLGTQPEVRDGCLTGRFATANCYGAEKVVRLKEVEPERLSYHLTAYGDSQGDAELLRYADEACYKPFRDNHE